MRRKRPREERSSPPPIRRRSSRHKVDLSPVVELQDRSYHQQTVQSRSEEPTTSGTSVETEELRTTSPSGGISFQEGALQSSIVPIVIIPDSYIRQAGGTYNYCDRSPEPSNKSSYNMVNYNSGKERDVVTKGFVNTIGKNKTTRKKKAIVEPRPTSPCDETTNDEEDALNSEIMDSKLRVVTFSSDDQEMQLDSKEGGMQETSNQSVEEAAKSESETGDDNVIYHGTNVKSNTKTNRRKSVNRGSVHAEDGTNASAVKEENGSDPEMVDSEMLDNAKHSIVTFSDDEIAGKKVRDRRPLTWNGKNVDETLHNAGDGLSNDVVKCDSETECDSDAQILDGTTNKNDSLQAIASDTEEKKDIASSEIVDSISVCESHPGPVTFSGGSDDDDDVMEADDGEVGKQSRAGICKFCNKFQSNLNRHVLQMHKSEASIHEAWKMSRASRLKAFMRADIFKHNKSPPKGETGGGKQTETDVSPAKPDLQNGNDFVLCNSCNGFFKASFFPQHRKLCFINYAKKAEKRLLRNISSVEERKKILRARVVLRACDGASARDKTSHKAINKNLKKTESPKLKNTQPNQETPTVVKTEYESISKISDDETTDRKSEVIMESLDDISNETKDAAISDETKVDVREINSSHSFADEKIAEEKTHNKTTNRKSKKCKRPPVPCFFCGQMRAHIAQHLMTNHQSETSVIEAMKFSGVDRTKAFEKLRRDGINKQNEKKKEVRLPVVEFGVRNVDELVVCSSCKGFYSRSYFLRHWKRCGEKIVTGEDLVPDPIENEPEPTRNDLNRKAKEKSAQLSLSVVFCRKEKYKRKELPPGSFLTVESLIAKSVNKEIKSELLNSSADNEPACELVDSNSDGRAVAIRAGVEKKNSIEREKEFQEQNNQSVYQRSAKTLVNPRYQLSNGESRKSIRKPLRPCVFCGEFQTFLVRHIKRKHGNEPSVLKAMSLTGEDRRKAISAFRREGILKHNMGQLKKKNPVFQVLRSSHRFSSNKITAFDVEDSEEDSTEDESSSVHGRRRKGTRIVKEREIEMCYQKVHTSKSPELHPNDDDDSDDDDDDGIEDWSSTDEQCWKKAAPAEKKPARPCPFCGKMHRKLSRHLMHKHKSEPAVIEAVIMDDVNRRKAFKKLLNEGIYKHNVEQIKKDNPVLQKRRDSKSNITGTMNKDKSSQSVAKTVTESGSLYDSAVDDPSTANDPGVGMGGSSSTGSPSSNLVTFTAIDGTATGVKAGSKNLQGTKNESGGNKIQKIQRGSARFQKEQVNKTAVGKSYKASIKPPRPCTFCGKLQAHLYRHLQNKHRGEPSVIQALKLTGEARLKAIAEIRREGILKHNIEQMTKDNPVLQAEHGSEFVKETSSYLDDSDSDTVNYSDNDKLGNFDDSSEDDWSSADERSWKRDSKDKNKPANPRPCPFCGRFYDKLTHHMKSKHKSEPSVIEAIVMDKVNRFTAVSDLRKEGVVEQNLEQVKKKNPVRQAEQGRKNKDDLVKRKSCDSSIVKKNISSHAKTCKSTRGRSNTTKSKSSMPKIGESTNKNLSSSSFPEKITHPVDSDDDFGGDSDDDTSDDWSSGDEESALQKSSKTCKRKKEHGTPRPCPFCERLYPKLPRHMKMKHKNEPSVRDAIQMNKVDQIKAFSVLRREGIYKYNLKQMKLNKPVLQAERGQQNIDELVVCNFCNGFVSKNGLSRHLRNCSTAPDHVNNGNKTTSVDNSGGNFESIPSMPGIVESANKDRSSPSESETATHSVDCDVDTGGDSDNDAIDDWSSADEMFKKRCKTDTKRHFKPRPCPFCGRLYAKLPRHMIFRHRQEPSVVEAMKMNKVDRIKAFSKLRRDGIYQFNLKQTKMKKPVLQAERGLQKKDDLVICKLCKSFVIKKSFFKHKRICNGVNGDSKNDDETVSDNNSGETSSLYRSVNETFGSIPSMPESANKDRSVSETFKDSKSCGKDTPDKNLDEESSNTTKTIRKKSRFHARPCPFCGRLQSRLVRHLKTKHKSEPAIIAAMKKDKVNCLKDFWRLRIEGIFKYNRRKLALRQPAELPTLRSNKKKKGKMVICSACNGFFKLGNSFWRHKRACSRDFQVPIYGLPVDLICPKSLDELDAIFKANVEPLLRSDDVGLQCIGDKAIMLFGLRRCGIVTRTYADPNVGSRRVVHEMRQLAAVYLEFKKCDTFGQKIGTAADMLSDQNFFLLRQSITSDENSTENNFYKTRKMIKMFLLLQMFAKIVKGDYLMHNDFERAKEIEQFTKLLMLNRHIFYNTSTYILIGNSEEDVDQMRKHCAAKFDTLSHVKLQEWNSDKFVELRDLTASRLTLFNARNGYDPSNLTISEFLKVNRSDSPNDGKLTTVDIDLERQFFPDLEARYHSEKENCVVPFLLPRDLLIAMANLCDQTIRQKSNVHADNKYVFAHIDSPDTHVVGWETVNGLCVDLGIENPERLTAFRARHRISTIYASLDVSKQNKNLFFKSMGYNSLALEGNCQTKAVAQSLPSSSDSSAGDRSISNRTGGRKSTGIRKINESTASEIESSSKFPEGMILENAEYQRSGKLRAECSSGSNMNKLTLTELSEDQSIGLLLTSDATEQLIYEASHVLTDTKLHSKSRSELKNQQTNSKIGNAGIKYICSNCGVGYKEKKRLNRHMMKHTGEYPFECSICGQKFRDKYLWRRHSKLLAANAPFKCTFCEKKFCKKSVLTKHIILTHGDGEKLFECDVCGKQFVDIHASARHKMSHTGEKPYECEDCGKKFYQNSDMVISIHRWRNHGGENPFKCSVCGYESLSRIHLETHMRSHTKEKLFECALCSKTFGHKCALVKHQRIHTGEKPYQCKQCGAAFNQSSTLKTHQRMHADDKPYLCTDCGSKFKLNSQLVIHKRIHTGEKPYMCNKCGKKFNQSSSLATHQKTHSNEKPYHCTVCRESFKLHSYLVAHERSHTGEKPFQCKVCDAHFNQMSSLNTHKKIHKK